MQLQRVLRPQNNIHVLPIPQEKLATARALLEKPRIVKAIGRETEWASRQDANDWHDSMAQHRSDFTASYSQLESFLRSNIFRGNRILEVGCGLQFADRTGRAPKDEDWVGLDIDPDVKKDIQRTDPRVQIETGSANALPFPDASFDVYFSHDFLYLAQNLPQALSEAYRVLRPGGYLLHFADCIPSTTALARELTARNLMTPEIAYAHFPLSLRKPTDEVQVKTPWSQDISTYYSILSMVNILMHLDGIKGFGNVENGLLASIVRAKDPDTFLRKFFAAQHALPYQSTAANWLVPTSIFGIIGWQLFASKMGIPLHGYEIYCADYILARKG